MLNICRVNVYYQNTSVDLHHISVNIIIYLGPRTTALKNWLKKLRTITLPMHFPVLDLDYGI